MHRGLLFAAPDRRHAAQTHSARPTQQHISGWAQLRGGARFPARVPNPAFRALTPERCLEAYHLHRTRLELIAERKVRRRQLTDDGNVEITGRDLREREVRGSDPRPIGYRRAAS
jgi:hypothetical protein